MNSPKKHWLDPHSNAGGPEENPKAGPQRHRKPAWVYLVPLLVLIGLALIFGYAFRDRLLPGIRVEVMSAIGVPAVPSSENANGANGGNAEPQLLFQATGWVEPDPLPIRVTPLYSGVVREVHVLEGQSVTNGEPLITLVDDDAQLAQRGAAANLAEARAVKEALGADLKLAQVRQITAIRKQEIEAARLAVESDSVRRLQALKPGTVPEQERVQVELRERGQVAAVAVAKAVLDERKIEEIRIEKQIEVQYQLIAVAQIKMEEAQLALSRTQVRSPVSGIVLRLLSTPGKRLMLRMDHLDAATAAILYEPDRLQARIDVPLADAGGLAVGQAVRLSCSLLPDRKFKGTVTRIVGEADLQRNTLQAKVRITDPDPRLRPEMLCRAEFFGSQASSPGSTSWSVSSSPLTVHIPVTATRNRKGADVAIWIVSHDERHAVSKTVKLGPDERDGYVPVLEGLNPGDRVIVNPPPTLKDGVRITPHATSDY